MAGSLAVLLVSMVIAMGPVPSRLPVTEDAPPLANIIILQLVNVLVIVCESLLLIAPWWLGAVGWGYPLRRWLCREVAGAVVIQAALGMALMLMLAWLAALGGLLNQATAWLLCAAGVVLAAMQLVPSQTRQRLMLTRVTLSWWLVLVIPAVGLLAVACCCPPRTAWRVEAFGYDAVTYHLQIPRQWLQLGRMSPLPHNVYSYFPNLMEVGFMQLGAMRGSMRDAVLAAQLFHASTGALAAGAVGLLIAKRFGTAAGFVGAAVLVATPWAVIVASSAYNEMLAMALGASALLLVLDARGLTWRGALAVGLLLGAATMAKLTAGPMLALPIGLIVLLRPQGRGDASGQSWSIALRHTAVVAVGIVMVLCPYLARNAVWAGNPVFPFATETFGAAHWSDAQVATWHDVHWPARSVDQRIVRLGSQWAFNDGYAGLWASPSWPGPDDARQFERIGVPSLVLLAAIVACVGLFRSAGGRKLVGPMVLLTVLQLVVWLIATKQASRYAFFTLLPGSVLIGAGCGALFCQPSLRKGFIRGWVVILLVAAVTTTSYNTFYQQFRHRLRPWQVIGAAEMIGDHPINRLPANSRTYMVADAVVFYVRNPVAYFSAWDIGPLGAIIRGADGDPRAVTHKLREAGFTHVWVNWAELQRIHRTIGTHDGLDAAELRRISDANWRVVHRMNDFAALYQLP